MLGTLGLIDYSGKPAVKMPHTTLLVGLIEVVRSVVIAASERRLDTSLPIETQSGKFEWTTMTVASPDEVQSAYDTGGMTAVILAGDCMDVSIEANGYRLCGLKRLAMLRHGPLNLKIINSGSRQWAIVILAKSSLLYGIDGYEVDKLASLGFQFEPPKYTQEPRTKGSVTEIMSFGDIDDRIKKPFHREQKVINESENCLSDKRAQSKLWSRLGKEKSCIYVSIRPPHSSHA